MMLRLNGVGRIDVSISRSDTGCSAEMELPCAGTHPLKKRLFERFCQGVCRKAYQLLLFASAGKARCR